MDRAWAYAGHYHGSIHNCDAAVFEKSNCLVLCNLNVCTLVRTNTNPVFLIFSGTLMSEF